MTPEREAAIRALVRDHTRTTPHVCVDEKEYLDGCLYLVCAAAALLRELDERASLENLVAQCKGSVNVAFNGHRDCYDSLEEYIDAEERFSDTPDDVRAAILEAGTVVEIQFYPDTPIGFYTVLGRSLDEAVDVCLETIARDREGK